jgi:transcriptional regulator with XRE-family HTH domain
MKQRYIVRIIERRNLLGWTQGRLAAELQLVGLDISQPTVSDIEREERRLDPRELNFFAAALGVDPNWLLEWEEFNDALDSPRSPRT